MEDVQPLKRCADIHWQPSRNTRTREEVDSEQLDNFLTLDFLDLLPWKNRWRSSAKGYSRALSISCARVNMPARPA
jgi:hypothetical protein